MIVWKVNAVRPSLACFALAIALGLAPAQAEEEAPPPPRQPEYMMPWERLLEDKPVVGEDDPAEQIVLGLGQLEVLRLPVAGPMTVITSHPEVAAVRVIEPNLLFLQGRAIGETVVVIADSALDPIFEAVIRVVSPSQVERW